MANIVIPYTPRPLQERLHSDRRRFSVIVCHRRFGKTVWAVNELLKTAITCKQINPVVAYIGPTYSQAKRVAWPYVRQFTEPLAKAGAVKYWDTELRCEIARGADKATIYLLGSENPDAIRGMYLDGAVLDEYAMMSPRVWGEIVRPALSDRKGWAVWIGTPAGHNHLHDIYTEAGKKMAEGKGWYSTLMKASDTQVIDDEELQDAQDTMTEAQYKQEYECDFLAALEGAFYGELVNTAQKEGRITAVPYQPDGEVYTAWDLGMDDYTAIWFCQPAGGEFHLIDYYENSGEGLEHYVKIVKEKGYNYAEHLFPHDAAVREMATGRSRVESLSSMGLQARIVPKLSPEDGINAARAIIPRCWFDAKKAFYGVECLRQYSRRKDRHTQMFLPKAKHDKFSHGADAFRALATGLPNFDPKAVEKRDRYQTRKTTTGTWMSA
jgi:hypothetical protein